MARKRASLKDKGEEILGVKRGGQGTDILFGSGGENGPQVSSRDAAVEAMMPPQEGEADLKREVDLDSLLGAEAEAAGGEAALPALATTPASPTPPPAEPVTPPQVVVRPSPAPPPATIPEPVVPATVTRPALESAPAVAAGAPTYPVASQPQAAVSTMPLSKPPVATAPYTPAVPVQPASVSSVPVVRAQPPLGTPPSTATGAPDLSAPRSLLHISMVGKDYDVLAEELSADAIAANLVGIPQGVTLTDEQRAQQLRRPSVRKKLVDLDKAIAGQYDRILQQDISVNKPITDWCHNTLAEARTIVLDLQVENLAKAEWDVEQVRARLDRADQSQRQSRVMAWPITIWGLLWFVIFVYLLFNPTFILRMIGVDTGSFTDAFLVPAIFLRALFFGGIGGVAAVFYHLFKYVRERSFDSQYALSYVGKPFMGMILGSMVYLMVFVLMRVLGYAPPGLSNSTAGGLADVLYTAVLFFVAMAAGFKENLAFSMLNRLIKTVLGDESPPEQGSTPPSTTSASGE
jgi:hypothetical protein